MAALIERTRHPCGLRIDTAGERADETTILAHLLHRPPQDAVRRPARGGSSYLGPPAVLPAGVAARLDLCLAGVLVELELLPVYLVAGVCSVTAPWNAAK